MDSMFAIENGILTKYTGPGGNVVVPNGVTAIGERAFLSCSTLRSVTIPEGVTEIGGDFFSEGPSGAFSGCDSLTSVVLPDSLREIGCWAFSGCKSLRAVAIPAKVEKIGNRAFQNCASLKNVSVPEGVREVDFGVFMGCAGLRNVELPGSVAVIREYAFEDCTGLMHMELPPRLRTIDYSAFHNCKSLRTLIIPGEVTDIGEFAFEDCTGFMSLTMGANVRKIGENAFRGCAELTIRTRAGSVADQYARSHDIPVVTDEELKDAAAYMLERAYAPYSKFPVGAALECEDGTIFTGCNVENAASPAGICAERNVIAHAISQGQTKFARIVIMSRGKDFCVPCGMCRQVMAEFAPDLEVVCLNGAGESKRFHLPELLPHAFGPSYLKSE